MSKYGAKKTTVGGVTFDSQAEYQCFQALSLLCRAKGLKVERNTKGVKLTAGITLRPDFLVTAPDGSIEYHEYKGAETAVYRVKKKLWKEYGPAPLYVWKGRGRSLEIVEVINPLK